MMLTAIAGWLAVQEASGAARSVLEAPLRVEESVAGSDAIKVAAGILRILPEGGVEADFAAAGSGGRRVVWRSGAARDPISAALDLWGMRPEEYERRFAVTVESEGEGGSGVVDGEGRPRAPVHVRWPRGVRPAVGPADPVAECLVLRLVPREEALRSKVRCLRAWVDPATRRPRRVAVEEEGRRRVFVAGDWRAVPPSVGGADETDSRKEAR
jgi:hypothetical protein